MTLWMRWLILTGSIILISYLMEDIKVDNFFTALLAAAALGVLNGVLRPVLILFTLPINILTFGLFTLIINALMLKISSWFIPGFEVVGFGAAFFGALIITLLNWLINRFMVERRIYRDEGDVIDLKKKGNDRWE